MIDIANVIKLRDDAIQDLLPVALVSRHFYTITVPLIYQNITLDISRYVLSQPYPEDGKYVLRPLSALATRLSAGPSVRALVRNVHVIGRMGASPEALELLQYWLPRFSQLISFSWDLDCPLPTTMLECLGRHWPSSHLHMRTSIAKCDIRKDRKTLELAPHMLRSLQVNMPNCGSREGEKEARITKQRFFWALNNCPGLQTLTTYFAWNSRDKYKRPPHPASRSSGPSGPPGLWHDIKLESPLPQLLELSVADRTFEVDDLLTWGAKGGWKKLKKITVWDHRLLQGFNGCEQSLRSIRLIDAKQGWEDNIGKICSRTMNLTELKIRTEDSRVPVSILEICGPSLTTLAIHHQDRGNDWSYIKDTPFKFLRAIQRLCPKVTNLALNLCWPLDSLASFPAYDSYYKPTLTSLSHRITYPLLAIFHN